MLFTIHILDRLDADLEFRPNYMARRLAYLLENRRFFQATGPISENDGKSKSSLWMVDVETIDQSRELVKADPFWSTDLRDNTAIKHWAQISAYRHPLA